MSQHPPQPPQPPSPHGQPPYPTAAPYSQGPYAPLPAYYGGGAPPRRPASVTTLAIIGIILGAFGILTLICGLLASFMPQPTTPNPVLDALEQNQAFKVYNVISSIIWCVLSLHLLVASISALNLKAWARRGMLLNAWASVVYLVVGGAIFSVIMFQVLGPLMRSQNPAEKVGAVFGLAGGLCMMLLMLLYPVFVILFMSKPHVVAAFEQENPTPLVPY